MAETIQNLRFKMTITGQVIGDDGARQSVDWSYSQTYTDGTAANQIGSIFQDLARPLNATNEDLDVSGGLTDFQGVAMALNNVKILVVENLDTDSGDVIKVTQPASNGVPSIFKAAGDGVVIPPGGLFVWIGPGTDVATVTAGTGDLINVEATDNSTYDILIGGDNA